MAKSRQLDLPRVSPTLFYDHPDAALGWLANSFGFLIRDTVAGKDGRIVHAELQIGDGVVMMAPPRQTPTERAPAHSKGK